MDAQGKFDRAVLSLQGGRLEEAGRLCREILNHVPHHADGLHLLGLVELQNGRPAAAAELIARAIAIDGKNPAYHVNLGSALDARGESAAALAAYTRALELAPGSAEILCNLGLCHQALGAVDAAADCYRRAVAANPELADAHLNLAAILHGQGYFDRAAASAGRAVALAPQNPDAHYCLGRCHQSLGALDVAAACYRRSIDIAPMPGDALRALGHVCHLMGDYGAAADCQRRAIAVNPMDAEAHHLLGYAEEALGRLDAAADSYRRALSFDPGNAQAHNNLGNALKDAGAFDAATECYRQAIALDAGFPRAWFNLADVKVFKADDPDLEALRRAAACPAEEADPYLSFALAKALDDAGDDAAFAHYLRANAAKRRQIVYDEPAVLARLREIASAWNGAALAGAGGDPSDRPVFVVGMPRSGTTLIEQILASHPQVHGAGELPAFEHALAETGASDSHAAALEAARSGRLGKAYLVRLPAVENKTRVVDKRPGNFRYIGLIRNALPHARIVHVRRDPTDTCVSCFFKLFAEGQAFTYDLGELGRYFRAYSGLMDHWRAVLPPEAMLEIRYEDLVEDFEGQVRRLLAYCGLPWDERCLSFHRTKRIVRSASAMQVRQPLYRASIGRWRRYEADLEPLLRELKRPL